MPAASTRPSVPAFPNMGFLLADPVSQELELLRQPLRLLVRMLTEDVETAADHLELSDRIDSMVEDARFHDVLRVILKAVSRFEPLLKDDIPFNSSWDRRLRQLSRSYRDMELHRMVDEGLKLDTVLIGVLEWVFDQGISFFPGGNVDANLMQFIDDSSLHPAIKSRLFDSLRHVVCSMIFTGIMDRDSRPKTWFMRVLVTLWLDTKKSYLKLLSSYPELASVPGLMELDERLDIPALAQEQARFNAACQALADHAERFALDVFPPFEEKPGV